MQSLPSRRSRSLERVFYSAMALAILGAVVLGFARTFYLKPWFPEAQHLAPPEAIFSVHGMVFTSWFLLLAAQPLLVARGAVRRHRQLGWLGAALAVLVVAFGTIAALVAARRPGGFIGVPLPPAQFLIIPLSNLFLFALFFGAALVWRRDLQSHKRCMLLAGISLVEAAVGRWPFAFVTAESPVPFFQTPELLTDAFVVPMIIWDLVSSRRVHPATWCGGLALLASQPLRLELAETRLWQQLASWLMAFPG